MRQAQSDKHLSGFSLIELMVVVAIVGILAAIAFPSYQDSVRKSRRADAKAVLQQAAQWMERFYTENNAYTAAALPASLLQAPIEGATKYYNIAITDAVTATGTCLAVAANNFCLTATPIAGGAMASDPCGAFTLTQTGAKAVTGTLAADQCWGG